MTNHPKFTESHDSAARSVGYEGKRMISNHSNTSRTADSAVSTLTQTAPSEIRERPILFSGAMVKAILEGRKTQTRRVIKLKRLVQPRKMVRGDAPFASHYCADPRWLYDAAINPHGAVSAQVATGDDGFLGLKPGEFDFVCPYADGETVLVSGEGWRVLPKRGQRLWVRETWMPDGADVRFEMMKRGEIPWAVRYAASEPELGKMFKWHPSIFMPRPACRIMLEITQVKLERLQGISEPDAIAEGIRREKNLDGDYGWIPAHDGDWELSNFPRNAFATSWDSINAKRDLGWEKNPWVWAIGFKRISGSVVR